MLVAPECRYRVSHSGILRVAHGLAIAGLGMLCFAPLNKEDLLFCVLLQLATSFSLMWWLSKVGLVLILILR